MLRRLYFLFPDAAHAGDVARELQAAGIGRDHLHAIARDDIDISPLPTATARQRSDRVWLVERIYWNANLALFGLALAGFIVSLLQGFTAWSMAALLVMAVTFLGGWHFAVNVPHVHLSEVRQALTHGEILLMVDVPRKRVAEVSELVVRRHPEAELGGVGWTIEAVGI